MIEIGLRIDKVIINLMTKKFGQKTFENINRSFQNNSKLTGTSLEGCNWCNYNYCFQEDLNLHQLILSIHILVCFFGCNVSAK